MPTSNELIFDSIVKQQVNLQRLSKGEANKLLRTLSAADKELSGLISSRLVEGQLPDFTTRRWQAMVTEIGRVRSSVIKSIGGSIDKAMSGTVDFTLKDTKALYQAATPVEVNFATPPLATVRELTRSKPFGGADMVQTLGEWMVNLSDADSGRIVGAVRQGIMNGETIPQIQRRVMKATKLTRQNSEAIARTAVNHAGNTARQEFFNENEEVIQALRWTATLDGRTSAICRARDGQYDAVEIGGDMSDVPTPHISGSPRRPPAHLRCRSIMLAVLDADTLAELERPFVADSRTRSVREKGFRAQAKQRVGKEKWSEMSRKQRAAEMSIERKDWTRKNVGTVPADTTYDEWLRRQSPEFQNEVLGEVKGEAFRNGVTMDQYVDRQGNELTITDLRENIHTQGKMPPPAGKEDIAGPGTPSVKQLEVEAKRQKTIEKNQLATAKREKRAAVKKAETERRRAVAAERKLEKEAKAAKRSEKAKAALEKKEATRIKAEEIEAKKVEEINAKLAEKSQFERAQGLSKDDPDWIKLNDDTPDWQREQFESTHKHRLEVEKKLDDPNLSVDDRVRLSHERSQYIYEELEIMAPSDDFLDSNPEFGQEWRRQVAKRPPPGVDAEEYSKWLNGLSDEEYAMFGTWGSEGRPKVIRDWQRGRLSKHDAASLKVAENDAKLLEGAIARAPQYQGTAYRGAVATPSEIKNFKPGMVFSEGALASSSFHSGVAFDFATKRAISLKKNPIVFKMEGISRGVVNMQHLGSPGLTFEGELLMSSSARFEVVSVNTRTGDGIEFTEVVLRAID